MAYFESMRQALRARRSVLNIRGRKKIWQWLREVEPRNAVFLMRALRRTQRIVSPAHYMSEYDLAPQSESLAARLRPPLVQTGAATLEC